jgi:hypothetical protein
VAQEQQRPVRIESGGYIVKRLNKRDEKFWHWFSSVYAGLPAGQDFPLSDEELYELWVSIWPVIYHCGMTYGELLADRKDRRSMGFFEMKRLYDLCPNKTGLELGILIEKWHGIG